MSTTPQADTAGSREAKSTLLCLPTELLYIVFEHIEKPSDVAALRATRSVLADVGLCYLLDEVALVYHSDKFRALKDIAAHPILAKRVKSLNFQADRFRKLSRDRWESARLLQSGPDDSLSTTNPVGLGNVHEALAPSGHILGRIWKVAARDGWSNPQCEANFSQWALKMAYARYKALYRDQQNIVRKHYDAECLETFFQGCSRLRHVTISFMAAQGTSSAAINKVFRPAMVKPYGDPGNEWDIQGCHVVHALAAAADKTALSLDSLTLSNVSPAVILWSFDDIINTAVTPAEVLPDIFTYEARMGRLFEPLRCLRISFACSKPENDNLDEMGLGTMLLQQGSLLRDGALLRLLAKATQLRVLDLSFLQGITTPGAITSHDLKLKYVLGELTFSHLEELHLSNCMTSEHWLTVFLVRHATTLQGLSIANMQLKHGTWKTFFVRIAGKLPALKTVKLRGKLESHRAKDEFTFSVPGFGHEDMSCPQRDAVEQYVLNGGEWPDLDCLPL